MPIEGEIDDADLRFRVQQASGEIEGEGFDISMNIDAGLLFVEFEEERVSFTVDDMVSEAYSLVYEEDPDESE